MCWVQDVCKVVPDAFIRRVSRETLDFDIREYRRPSGLFERNGFEQRGGAVLQVSGVVAPMTIVVEQGL